MTDKKNMINTSLTLMRDVRHRRSRRRDGLAIPGRQVRTPPSPQSPEANLIPIQSP
jgi:hypothetical protein